MHLTQVSSFLGASRPALQGARQYRLQMDRLIQQSIEQQPTRARGASIEPEREFVQIVIQVRGLNGALVRPQKPTLQQGRHSVGSWQQVLSNRRCRPDDLVPVSQPGQATVTPPTVGLHGAAWFGRLAHSRLQVWAAGARYARQSNPPDAFARSLSSDHDQDLARSTPASFAGAFSTHEDLVHFHRAAQPIPPRSHHGPPQFVQPMPGGAITAQTEDALHAQGTGAVLLVGDMPQGFEPKPQRFVRVGKQRAGRDRNMALAALAAKSA